MKKRTIFNTIGVAISLILGLAGYRVPTLAQDVLLEVTIALISGSEPIEIMANGQPISLSAKPNPSSGNFAFSWTLSGRGKLLSKDGQVATYQAPGTVEAATKATITVTVMDKKTRKRATDSIIIALKPGGTAIQPSGVPVIDSPRDGEQVNVVVEVRGKKATGDKNLYVVIQPEGYGFIAQPPATVKSNGTWLAQGVNVGQAGDEGLSFTICAVVTAAELPVGREQPSMPEGPSSCITVKRKLPPPPPPCLQPPVITSQKNGDSVPMFISVEGIGAPSGCNFYILIRPQDFNYWVQAPPIINADGTWRVVRARVGEEQDAGKPFTICTVLTSQVLNVGQQLGAPPEPKSCVEVIRM